MEITVKPIDAVIFVGTGLSISFRLLLGGLSVGLFLGLTLAILRHNGIGRRPIAHYVSLLRGTPVLLQLSLIYFAIPGILGVRLSVLSAGIITFGLNSSAYMSEIFRSGIEGLPRGQFEAAQTLGIPRFFIWKDIILPQVFTAILPALTGEVIALLKETALIATIGGADIMRKSQVLAAEQFTYFMPLCIAGFYYYFIVLFVESLSRRLERRLRRAHH
ncbi:MAG: amino acid ABC transporter permease [Puniceicoccales bacterium]|jgi:polar amino acid transport system permease protein|nr:amino acid ABC transporter permease [Puniceicoccales bacterium]